MKAKNLFAAVLAILVLPLAICGTAHAQGTAFTYQGQLAESGSAANGNFDFVFGLYTNVSTGNLIGTMETNLAVGVTNGLFTTTLNFSNAFNGTAYWLGIGVRSNGTTNAFTTLTPRQAITPTPYAITASNLTGTLSASQLAGQIASSNFSGTFSNTVTFTNPANVFVGNGANLTNVPGVTQSNLFYAYDTTGQAIATAGTFQDITFTTATVDGWTAGGSGMFAPNQAGTYLVQYQAHFANGNSTTTLAACIRAMLNATTELTGSEAVIYVPPDSIGLASRSFIVSMTAGQTLSLQMTGDLPYGTSGGYGYLDSSTFYGQFFPSISMTAVRVQ